MDPEFVYILTWALQALYSLNTCLDCGEELSVMAKMDPLKFGFSKRPRVKKDQNPTK